MKRDHKITSIIVIVLLVISFASYSQQGHYTKAISSYERENYSVALSHLDKITNADDRDVRLLRAKVLYELKQYENIEKVLGGLENLDEDARIALASSYQMTEQYDKARELWKTLLVYEGAEVDEALSKQRAVIYSNVGDTFYSTAQADSAIYYMNQALSLAPFDTLFLFNVALAYSANDESDKACAHYFLSSRLKDKLGAEYYESENCISWKNEWLKFVPGERAIVVANNFFPDMSARSLSWNEDYIFEEYGNEMHVKVAGINKTPAGVVFTLQDDSGQIYHRWASAEIETEWQLLTASAENK